MLLLIFSGCATFKPVPAPQKGSLENPICTTGVYEQRQFLRRLRYPDGTKVGYERQKPILSPERRILDPYHVWPDRGSPFGPLFQSSESDPLNGKTPAAGILYFELRSSCSDDQIPPGFMISDTEAILNSLEYPDRS